MNSNQKQWSTIVLAIVVGVSLVGYRAYTSLLPIASEYIAEKIPEAVYQSIGEASLENFDESEFSESNIPAERQQEINAEFRALLQKLNLAKKVHNLYFRQWNGEMNAFALMDGSIVVTDALINKLENTRQLQAVLLHEIGHIEHNHLMENTIRVSLFYISMSLIFGDIGVVSDLLIESSALGLNFSYSRAFEEEADLFSANSLINLYGSSEAIIEVLTLLYENNEENSFQWISTHPSLEDRVRSIKFPK